MRSAISLALLLIAAPAEAQQTPTPYQRAIAAGYKAAMYCSGIFDAGRTPQQIDAEELHGIYPEYDAIVPTLKAVVQRQTGIVTVAWADTLPPRQARWGPITGCTLDPVGTTERATLPAPTEKAIHPAAADPRPWPMGDAGIHPIPKGALANTVATAFDGSTYGPDSDTTGVVVVRDGTIVAEHYAKTWGPLTANRSWSVAKSISGTLIGLASPETAIDVKQPASIPEWAARAPVDPRIQITLDQLLRMASGLHSDTAGNRTDAIYFGGATVTEDATHWPIEAKPGTRFRYANDDILLAVRSLRATLGETRYADFPTTALFAPLGMAHTRAGKDWRGNYILSSQVWTTARDLARLGQFWLDDGVWAGKRMLPEGWMTYMTTPSGPQPASGPGYGATMWLFGPTQGLPAGSYAAQGNRGQYVMVIPSKRLIVVRRGEDPGTARFDIARFAADVAKALP